MTPEIDLSGLRDLHLMTEPDFWPLATGWWILLGGLFAGVLLILLGYVLWRKRPAVYAARKVDKFTRFLSDDLAYLKELSTLLKRVAIAADGREKTAALTEDKWQNFLLHRATQTFTEKEAELIAFAPYLTELQTPLNRPLLATHTKLWIKKVFKNKKSS